MFKPILVSIAVISSLFIAGCERDAQIASRNLSKAADMFEINRRVIFYNGITGEYMLAIEGRCSLEVGTDKLAVICKTGPNQLKKHYLGLSDNVTFFAEQLEFADASVYHHRIIFKPQSILPNIDFEGDADALVHDLTK